MIEVVLTNAAGFEGVPVNYLQAYDFIDNRYRQVRRELQIQGLVYTPESIRFHEQMVLHHLLLLLE